MLNTQSVSISLALTSEMAYIVCAFFFYLFPGLTLRFFNTWMHGVDLQKIASDAPVSISGLAAGFVTVFIASYAAGLVFALIYNAINRK